MGKKYIIELEEPEMFDDRKFYTCSQMPWWAVSENIVENLTPYTEPDLEQVRKEAYDKSMGDAEMLAYKLYSPKIDEAYQHGLNEAWDAARKIWQSDIYLRIFKVPMRMDCFTKFSASEAIEKIRQYEQEQKEKITKGDVVRIKSAPEVEILVTCADGGHVSGIALTEVDDNCEIGDQYTDIVIHNVEKTGRHYEIAEVLQKMKEES